ncbi:MAG TPA: hypothetical protein VI383_03300 [Gemmatimonadales bacterium]|nr:hypothetical protein [Gemmatimonadales bacterium]
MNAPLKLGLGVVVSAALAVACDGGTGPSENPALVQLLQADPAAPPTVSLVIDEAVVATSVAYGYSSPKISTPAGLHRLAIRSGAGTVAEIEGELRAGATYYLVSAQGDLYLTEAASLDPGVTPDTGQRNPVRANIRFVNVPGPPAAPALVYALLSAPATVDTVQRFGMDTRVASYGTLMYVDPGTVTVRFQPQDQEIVLAEVVFEVAAGEVKAVVLEREPDGALRARVVVEE